MLVAHLMVHHGLKSRTKSGNHLQDMVQNRVISKGNTLHGCCLCKLLKDYLSKNHCQKLSQYHVLPRIFALFSLDEHFEDANSTGELTEILQDIQ